jgi:hypothetical protein
MKPIGRNGVESPIEKDLPSRGEQEIRAANDFGYAHGNVIHHHGEFIGRYIFAIPNEKVTEVPKCGFFYRAKIFIRERDRNVIRNTEAPVHACRTGEGIPFAWIHPPLYGKDWLLFMWGE